jgi:hypothetical protein
MKRIQFWIWLVAPALAVVGCRENDKQFERDFKHAIDTAISENRANLELYALNKFEWDKCFVFFPYTPPEFIDAQLGFKWNDSVKTEIGMNDWFQLLVFVKGGRVVKYSKIRRNLCQWDLSFTNGFTPERAQFVLESHVTSVGRDVLVRLKD